MAISFPDRSFSYAELRDASARAAGVLTGCERVAVIAEPRLETCVAVIAALRAGVPIVPLNPSSGPAELEHILTDSTPEAVLSAPDTIVADALRDHCRVAIELDRAGGQSPSEPVAHDPETPGALDPEAPALIVYTSGTTGRPKGAILPRRAITSNLDALAQAWAWTERDVVAHALPLFHVHGLVIGILGPIRRAGTAHHLGRFSPGGVHRALTGGATMLFGVPTMYRRLAEAAERDPELAAALGRARLLVSGSAALAAIEHQRLRRLTGRGVVERYGMTETLMSTAIRADGEPAPGTVGAPLEGVQLRLVDDQSRPIAVQDGETIGEIEVRGPNLFLGYLNREDATAAAMRDGWFATGDLARRDRRGYIELVGRRATDLIKSGGYKIGAGEIEGALREHPAVDDAAVKGEPDDDLGQRVVAWVTLRDGESVGERELIDHVAALLAPHKRPRAVRFLDELPRNELGKVQKNRLDGD